MKNKVHKNRKIIFLTILSLILQFFSIQPAWSAELSLGDEFSFGQMQVRIDNFGIASTDIGGANPQLIGLQETNPLQAGEDYYVFCKLILSDCRDLTTTEQGLQLDLPAEFSLNGSNGQQIAISVTPQDDEGNPGPSFIGAICKIENNKAVLYFQEELKNYDGVWMYFYVGSNLNSDQVISENKKTLEFGLSTLGTSKYSYKEDFYLKPEHISPPSLKKEGSSFNKETHEVSWKVTVKATDTPITTKSVITLIDEFDNSFQEFLSAKISYPGKSNVPLTNAELTQSLIDTTTQLTYTLGTLPNDEFISLEPGEEMVLEVITKVKDAVFTNASNNGKNIPLKNTAFLSRAGNLLEGTQKESASISVQVNWISKDGKKDPSNINKLDWTITLNTHHMNLKDYTLKDWIPEGLNYDISTPIILTNKDTNTSSLLTLGNNSLGDLILQNTSEANDDLNVDGKTGSDEIKSLEQILFTFNSDTTATYELRYSTLITNPAQFWNQNRNPMFYNIAGIGKAPDYYKSFKGVGITSSMVSKSGTYDASQEIITWTIIFNANKNEVENPTLKDLFKDTLNTSEDKKIIQTFIPNSLKLSKQGDTNKVLLDSTGSVPVSGLSATYAYTNEEDTETIEVNLAGTINEPWELTYQTKVENTYHTATNQESARYPNEVLFNGKIPTGGDYPTSSASASVLLKSKVIDKTPISYNYAAKEAKWVITINQNNMSLPYNASTPLKITEHLPNGHILENLKLYEGTTATGTDYASDTSLGVLEKEVDLNGKKVATYTFKQGINKPYTFLITTKIPDEVAEELFKVQGDYTLSNTATIEGSVIPTPQQSQASMKIKNPTITKDGKQVTNDAPITWEILINPNRIQIAHPTIVDKLPYGLEIDPTSIKLYKMTIRDEDIKVSETNPQIIQSIGTPLTITPKDYVLTTYKNDLAQECSQLTFYVPSENGIGTSVIQECYKLVFDTDVVIAGKTIPFSNTAQLQGESLDTTLEDKVQNVTSNFSSSGGGTLKYKGKIALKKVDVKNTNLKLEGALFALYKNGVDTGRRVTTDENGEAFFDRLKVDSNVYYQIVEVKQPEGYKLPAIDLSQIEKNYLSDSVFQKTLVITNEAAGYPISFTKVDSETNESLSGSIFKLYTQSDYNLNKLENAFTSITTSLLGEVYFPSVPYGQYILKEETAPIGYNLSTQVYDVTVTKTGEVTLSPKGASAPQLTTLPNNRIKGNIQITKKNVKGQPIANVTYALYKDTYTPGQLPLTTQTTNQQGEVIFNGLSYGKYEVIELSAPSQYAIDATPLAFNIEEEGRTYEKEVINGFRGDYMIYAKKEDSAGKPLGGAKFSLLNEGGSELAVAFTHPTTGIAEFTNITYGTYTLKEVVPPTYYVFGKNTEQSFTLTPEQKDKTVTFINDLGQDGRIKVIKTDKQAKPLKGAIFTLYNKEGEPVHSATSVANGEALFNNVVYGKYTLKETKAPSGYIKSNDILEVNVINNALLTYTIINKPEDTTPSNPGGSGGGSLPQKPIEPTPPEHELPLEEEKPTEKPKETPREPSNNIPLEIINHPVTKEKIPTQVIEIPTTGEKIYLEVTVNPETNEIIPTGLKVNPTTGEKSPINLEELNHLLQGQNKTGMSNTADIPKPQALDSQSNSKHTGSTKKTLPQAGGPLDTKALVLAGILLISVGFGFVWKCKKTKNEI
ncbi:hypothetical protein CS063_16095 [Sporanaerobium hydrogeniformans]|uniref:Uncharacterized protein n=1 Tax=Sporanaerobium hydrogeniformans TaxID=3072179 RepID=A0AC61D8E0_9FIRM|nr:SpaA isopeptide-forming pilin-related protein [Sporanaerobium hydrogeniformans]PHV69402.1 hypothetical protein CS063_16095 [Sporanaerobium hydrogeniformans]